MMPEHRTVTLAPKWEMVIPVVLALVSLLLSGAVGYTHNDKANEHRITAAEMQIEHMKEQRVEDHELLLRIDQKMDRILEWGR